MSKLHRHYEGTTILEAMSTEEIQKMMDTRTVRFIASTEDRNRHGTKNILENWQIDNYNANGVVGYQHNVYGNALCQAPDPDEVIGVGHAFKDTEARKLMIDVSFEPSGANPIADKVFNKLTKYKTLKTVSPGFTEVTDGEEITEQDAGGEKISTYVFGKIELLEVSVVNIPANAGALKQSFRDSTYSAISHLMMVTGGKFSYAEIEKMSVRNVLDLMDNRRDVTDATEEKVSLTLQKLKNSHKYLLNEI